MNRNVQVGTCGLSGSKAEYARQFSCVEIQQTFYQPPQLGTLARWRNEVLANFEFTLKAWQLITHSAKSPTYKRLRRQLTTAEQQAAGSFKPTTLVDEAWHTTLACAQAVKAKAILFQCPASFTQTPENVRRLVHFFSRIDRNGVKCCWEPRGPWDNELLSDLCEDLSLWHVVDPFVRKTMTPDRCYFRLHGRQDWRYQYEPSELVDLAELLPTQQAGYVFFNNSSMKQDALAFKRQLDAAAS
ncbi:DUF72 domain-containing protein [Fibrella arboris]|uniref:DUF72 domain-containing protein n=1 Tax=Fibrella arboris TaxID=3242486 RepID=UPI0035223E3E